MCTEYTNFGFEGILRNLTCAQHKAMKFLWIKILKITEGNNIYWVAYTANLLAITFQGAGEFDCSQLPELIKMQFAARPNTNFYKRLWSKKRPSQHVVMSELCNIINFLFIYKTTCVLKTYVSV